MILGDGNMGPDAFLANFWNLFLTEEEEPNEIGNNFENFKSFLDYSRLNCFKISKKIILAI